MARTGKKSFIVKIRVAKNFDYRVWMDVPNRVDERSFKDKQNRIDSTLGGGGPSGGEI